MVLDSIGHKLYEELAPLDWNGLICPAGTQSDTAGLIPGIQVVGALYGYIGLQVHVNHKQFDRLVRVDPDPGRTVQVSWVVVRVTRAG